MLHEQLEHQNAANTMENGRFKTQKRGKHLVEMAASNSEMLQVARKIYGSGDQKKVENKEFPKHFLTQNKGFQAKYLDF